MFTMSTSTDFEEERTIHFVLFGAENRGEIISHRLHFDNRPTEQEQRPFVRVFFHSFHSEDNRWNEPSLITDVTRV